MSKQPAGLLKRTVQGLGRGAGAFAGRIKHLFVRRQTDAEVRADDKANQSRVRRTLRGLPAEHEQRDPHQSK